MAWMFVVLGVLVSGGGLWLLAKGPSATAAAAEMDVVVPRAKAVGETPWSVIMEPLTGETPGDRKKASRPFRMGMIIGLGFGVIFTGMLWALAGNRTPSQDEVVRIAKDKYHLLVVQPTGQTVPTSPTGTASANPTAVPAVTGTTAGGTTAKPTPQTLLIEAGDTLPVIATKLKGLGVIKDMAAFQSRVVEQGLDTALQAGVFKLQTNMSNDEVIAKLTAH